MSRKVNHWDATIPTRGELGELRLNGEKDNKGESMESVNPISITCPHCKASIGARCTEPVRDGHQFVSYFHRERLEAAEKEKV